MTFSETSLNLDESVLNLLKNQTLHEKKDLQPQVEIRVTLSSDHLSLILWNGHHELTLTPDGATGQFLHKALLRQQQKADELRLSKPAPKKLKKKNKNKKQEVSPIIQKIPEGKSLVISNYISLGAGKGKVLKPPSKVKKAQPKVFSVADL